MLQLKLARLPLAEIGMSYTNQIIAVYIAPDRLS